MRSASLHFEPLSQIGQPERQAMHNGHAWAKRLVSSCQALVAAEYRQHNPLMGRCVQPAVRKSR
jgi:hypothetical protein